MFERTLGPNTNNMFRMLFSVPHGNRLHKAIVYSYDIKALIGEVIFNNLQPDLERFRHSYFNWNVYFQCIVFATNIPQIIVILRTILRKGLSLCDFKYVFCLLGVNGWQHILKLLYSMYFRVITIQSLL